MMNLLKNPYNTSKARRVLEGLRLNKRPQDELLAGAIETFLSRSLSTEEQRWVDRIEALREQLLHSTETLPIEDWGLPTDATVGATVQRPVSRICRSAATPPLWGLLMFALIRHFKPNSCLELGTSLGISSAYQGAALELNGKGRLITMEGAAALAGMARRNFKQTGINRIDVVAGRFQDTLETTLAKAETVDFAFIDGHHDEAATQQYFKQIFPYLTPNAVVVFDDISWSEGMRNAWSDIIRSYRVRTAVDLAKWGICLLDPQKQPAGPQVQLRWHPSRLQQAAAKLAFAG